MIFLACPKVAKESVVPGEKERITCGFRTYLLPFASGLLLYLPQQFVKDMKYLERSERYFISPKSYKIS